MDILEKDRIWLSFRFKLPMIICAMWVITKQRKIIWSALKMRWKNSWSFRNWIAERTNFLKMFGVFIITLAVCCNPITSKKCKELYTEQEKQYRKKLIADGIFTEEQLRKEDEIIEQEKQEFAAKKKRKPSSHSLFNISPLLGFFSIVIIAPIIEECVFRYLVFEIFGKNKPFAYIFSALSFIFLHWTRSIFNYTVISYLLLTYFPITFLLIYSYRKSKWNIAYPIFWHSFWNIIAFICIVKKTKI